MRDRQVVRARQALDLCEAQGGFKLAEKLTGFRLRDMPAFDETQPSSKDDGSGRYRLFSTVKRGLPGFMARYKAFLKGR